MLTVVVPRAKVPLCAMSMTQWTSPDNTDVRLQRPAKVALGFASLRDFLDGQISLIARPAQLGAPGGRWLQILQPLQPAISDVLSSSR